MGAGQGAETLLKQPRRPTSSDVAARAGVSRTTVSFVLNGRADTGIASDTRARVLQAAADLGYHAHGAAQALAGGLSIRSAWSCSRPRTRSPPTPCSPRPCWASATRRARTATASWSSPLSPEGPAVQRPRPLSGASTGSSSRARWPTTPSSAASSATGFPIDPPGLASRTERPQRGCGQPDRGRHCCRSPDRAGAPPHRLHHQRAARLHGGRRPAGWLPRRPARRRDRARRAARRRGRVRRRERPCGHARPARRRAPGLTAVFVASDIVAFGALRALREAGRRVPDDISVVGFDDIPLARHFDPPLTTIRLPARALGAAAGRALVDRLAGRPVTERTLLPTELVVRESTAVRQVTGGPCKHRRSRPESLASILEE